MCTLQRDVFQEKERKDDDSNEFVSAVTWKPVGGLEWLCCAVVCCAVCVVFYVVASL